MSSTLINNYIIFEFVYKHYILYTEIVNKKVQNHKNPLSIKTSGVYILYGPTLCENK